MRRRNAQIEEATELVRLYRERYEKDPSEYDLREHFWLFSDDPDNIPDCWKAVNQLCGNEAYTNEVMCKHKKKFQDMKTFLEQIDYGEIWQKKL